MKTRGVYKSKCKEVLDATDFDTLTSRANREALKNRLTRAAQTDQQFFERCKVFAFDEMSQDDIAHQKSSSDCRCKELEQEKQILREEHERTSVSCARLKQINEERTRRDFKLRHNMRVFRDALQNTVNYVSAFIDLNHVLRYFDMMVMQWCIPYYDDTSV
jgi:transcriptional regulator of acetoin/glycerol metabolism